MIFLLSTRRVLLTSIREEILAMQIASIHNLAFYVWLTQEARRQILAGTFKSWKDEMICRVTTRL